MLIYIFKSAACMAIFFVFYKFLLERETMHIFKRFYLLLAIGASLVIPALVFTEYVVVEPIEYTQVPQFMVSDYEHIGVPAALENDVLDIEPVLWTVYFLGFVFFGFRFIKNLFQIIRRVRKNPRQKATSFIQVLLRENFPPHTFFNYIFLNKKKLEANEIPKEVLLHEETHARQKHSFDVVFIEFLQVIFWFNPLIYLFKKAIKLNHEFLADQAVLDKNIDETTYQNTLLSYLSTDSEKKYQPKLANSINYSSIKKRFTLMKTQTSKKAILYRSLLLLPLLSLVIYGFSETNIIEETTSQSVEKIAPVLEKQKLTIDNDQVQIVEELVININKKGKLLIFNQIVVIEELPSFLSNYLSDVTENELQKTLKATIRYDVRSPQNVIDEVKNVLRKNNIVKLNMEKLNFLENANDQNSVTKKQLAEYNTLAKKYNTMLSKNKSVQIKMKDVERLKYIYGQMSDKQKADAEPFPDFPEPPPAPKAPKAVEAPKVKKGEKSDIPPPPSTSDLSDEEFAEKVIEETIANQDPHDRSIIANFNSPKVLKGEVSSIPPPAAPQTGGTNGWAVSTGIKNGSRPKDERTILPPPAPVIAFDVDSKSYSKELTSSIQEYLKSVEAYEQAIQDYKERKLKKPESLNSSYEKTMKLYKSYYELAHKEGKFIQPAPPPQDPKVLKAEISAIPAPPAPPTPISPLDHVIEMAKKDATFYYEGKEISADKAIAILKKDKSINIDSRGSNGKKPVVQMSTQAISIEN